MFQIDGMFQTGRCETKWQNEILKCKSGIIFSIWSRIWAPRDLLELRWPKLQSPLCNFAVSKKNIPSFWNIPSIQKIPRTWRCKFQLNLLPNLEESFECLYFIHRFISFDKTFLTFLRRFPDFYEPDLLAEQKYASTTLASVGMSAVYRLQVPRPAPV